MSDTKRALQDALMMLEKDRQARGLPPAVSTASAPTSETQGLDVKGWMWTLPAVVFLAALLASPAVFGWGGLGQDRQKEIAQAYATAEKAIDRVELLEAALVESKSLLATTRVAVEE